MTKDYEVIEAFLILYAVLSVFSFAFIIYLWQNILKTPRVTQSMFFRACGPATELMLRRGIWASLLIASIMSFVIIPIMIVHFSLDEAFRKDGHGATLGDWSPPSRYFLSLAFGWSYFGIVLIKVFRTYRVKVFMSPTFDLNQVGQMYETVYYEDMDAGMIFKLAVFGWLCAGNLGIILAPATTTFAQGVFFAFFLLNFMMTACTYYAVKNVRVLKQKTEVFLGVDTFVLFLSLVMFGLDEFIVTTYASFVLLFWTTTFFYVEFQWLSRKISTLLEGSLTVREILLSRVGLALFAQYCVKEFSIENLYFLLEAYQFMQKQCDDHGFQLNDEFQLDFREIVDTRKSLKNAQMTEHWSHLYETYISKNAPLMINVSSETRTKASKVIAEAQPMVDILKQMTMEVMQNLRDTFGRFRSTDEFNLLLLALSKKSEEEEHNEIMKLYFDFATYLRFQGTRRSFSRQMSESESELNSPSSTAGRPSV